MMSKENPNEGDNDGVFPSNAWAVTPTVFLSQLVSPGEVFIRLFWAPFLIFASLWIQGDAIAEMGAWSILVFVFLLPFITWSMAAILFTNEYRKSITEAMVSEVPSLFEFLGGEVIVAVFQGLFRFIGYVFKLIFHIFHIFD